MEPIIKSDQLSIFISQTPIVFSNLSFAQTCCQLNEEFLPPKTAQKPTKILSYVPARIGQKGA